jgi:hypothetical protein
MPYFNFMKGERWRPIPGYEMWYDVSNKGRVRSYHAPGCRLFRLDVPQIKGLAYSPKYEYLATHLSVLGRKKNWMVHILVAMAFKKNPLNKRYVNHKNGNKLDNRASNVEWCTLGENQRHAYRTGLKPRLHGERNGRNLMSKKDVIDIFNSKETNEDIAAAYGIRKSRVSHIKTGYEWGDVTGKKYVKKRFVLLSKNTILRIYNDKGQTKELSVKYNVWPGTISAIKTGRSNSSITGHVFKRQKGI